MTDWTDERKNQLHHPRFEDPTWLDMRRRDTRYCFNTRREYRIYALLSELIT